MQSETKARVDQLTSPAGHDVAVLRFEGDIASTSKDAVLGTYQTLPRQSTKIVLLDFSKVDYINSSGIALVIQLLIEASNAGQKVCAFGLSRISPRCLPWWASPVTPASSRARRKRWRPCSWRSSLSADSCYLTAQS